LTAESIAWAFATFDQSNWHPLTWISHMVDWKLYGNNPSGHHLTNLFLHTANAILLFLLLLYMTGYQGRSAIVAFLFALHPAHVESVAWISERKDLLCAFFYFAALLVYAWYVRNPSWKRYVTVVLAFACALMSKPMAVTLPFTLLLLDLWPLRRISFTLESRPQWLSIFLKLCLEKWPLFILAILSSIITFLAQRAGHSVAELQSLPLWERISSAAISYCRYIRIMIWPNPLTAYYYYDLTSTKVFATVLSTIALILVTAACWHYRKTKPYCLVGWLWFLGTLVPVIGIVQVGEQVMAERYTYLPFIGLFIAIVWLISDAVTNYPKISLLTQIAAVALIAAYAVKTDAQVKIWKNTVTLFTHALEVDPRGVLPNLSLGAAYMNQGDFAEAQEYFERALIYNPSRSLTLSYSAFSLMQSHDPRNLPLAGQRLKQALSIAPNDPDALTNMALWSALMGRPNDEDTYSRKALAAQPDFITARLYLADALRAQNKPDQAAAEYRQAIAANPNIYVAHNSLGIVLDRQGLKQEAMKEFQISLAIEPRQAAAHSNIGRILMQSHQFPEATSEFTQALRLDPANPSAHDDLGVALFQAGDYENSAVQFSEALKLNPADSGARRSLEVAQVLMKNRRIEDKRK
jgi:tetratricopeptide (TPR) repeat protein